MNKFVSNIYVHKVKKKSFWNNLLYLLAIPLFSKNSIDCHKKKNVFVYFLSHYLYCWSTAVVLNNAKAFLYKLFFSKSEVQGIELLINLGYED